MSILPLAAEQKQLLKLSVRVFSPFTKESWALSHKCSLLSVRNAGSIAYITQAAQRY